VADRGVPAARAPAGACRDSESEIHGVPIPEDPDTRSRASPVAPGPASPSLHVCKSGISQSGTRRYQTCNLGFGDTPPAVHTPARVSRAGSTRIANRLGAAEAPQPSTGRGGVPQGEGGEALRGREVLRTLRQRGRDGGSG
jgi:hypothetical protein